jgi:DNA-binding NarL/FixJ family response regulator
VRLRRWAPSAVVCGSGSATGFAGRQIAEEIELSEATVKTHFEHIYRKLGVPDRASAVAEGLRQGLIH